MATVTITPVSAATKSSPAAAAQSAPGRHDPHCFACGEQNTRGLQLLFKADPDNRSDVTASWIPPCWSTGYPEIVHGGLIASALDAAMTNALLAKDICALTVELTVRYCRSVAPGVECVITGQCVSKTGPIFHVAASLSQNGKRCAHAKARFMNAKPEPHLTCEQ